MTLDFALVIRALQSLHFENHHTLKRFIDSIDQTQTTTISTDSRKAAPGCIFIAIKGEKIDGAQFIPDVLKAGAALVITESTDIEHPKVIKVSSSIEVIRRIAKLYRDQFQHPVIAVVGNVGKTTTKQFLTALLHGRYTRVHSTQGSQNGYLGIALTLLDLNPNHEISVVEIGIDEPGAMQKHIELVAPNACIVPALGPEHLEKLISVENAVNEEWIAVDHVLKTSGLVALNISDQNILKKLNTISEDDFLNHAIGFSIGDQRGKALSNLVGSAQFRSKVTGSYTVDPPTLTIDALNSNNSANSDEKIPLEVALPLPGAHNASNLLGAISLVHNYLKFSNDEIKQGLKSFIPATGRSVLKRLAQLTDVLCDYYNSNPESLAAGLLNALELSRIKSKKLYIIAGDMLELGNLEQSAHCKAIEDFVASGAKKIYLFGPRFKTALEQTPRQNHATCYLDHSVLTKQLLSDIEQDSTPKTVFIKGSRGMRLEVVFQALEKHLGEAGGTAAPETK